MPAVLATPRNMRRYEQRPRKVGDCTIYPKQPVAYSLLTGEQFSATPGDYFMLGDDEPITDDEGNPCYLAFERVTIEVIDTDEL